MLPISRLLATLFLLLASMPLSFSAAPPAARNPSPSSPNRFLAVKEWVGTISYTLNYSNTAAVQGGSISRMESRTIRTSVRLTTRKKGGTYAIWLGSYSIFATSQKTETLRTAETLTESTEQGSGTKGVQNFETLNIDTAGKVYTFGTPDIDIGINTVTRSTILGMTETQTSSEPQSIGFPAADYSPLPASGMILAGIRKIKVDITLNPEQPKVAEGTLTWRFEPAGADRPEVNLSLLSKNARPKYGEAFTVRGSWKNCVPEAARFILSDVSNEPGVCMNDPTRQTKPDLEFIHTLNGDRRFAAAETAPGIWSAVATGLLSGNQLDVHVKALDYGGWGVVRFEVKVNGEWITATPLPGEGAGADFVRIPYDTDRNHIADFWEKAHGVSGQPATYDTDLNGTTGGQATAKDGMTLYQEYRGFYIVNSADKTVWQEMDPKRKEVFYLDDKKIIDAALFEEFTKIKAYRVKKPYVGEGNDYKTSRIVDLCRGYAAGARKYALNIYTIPGNVDPNILHVPASQLVWQLGYTADGGSPRNADFCFIFPDRITELLTYRANQLKKTLPPNPDAGLLKLRNEAGITQAQAELIARRWTPQMSAQLAKDYLRFISVHEMTHACGASHHGSKASGEEFFPPKGCIMRYLRVAEEWKYLLAMLQNPHCTLKGSVYWNVCRQDVNCWSKLRADDN